MNKRKGFFCLIVLLLLPMTARAADWENHSVRCPDHRLGCRLLQMVMMGSFDDFQPDDPLKVRLFSAVYPQLRAVTEDDFEHFLKEFDAEEAPVRVHYYRALAHCLWADLLFQGLPRSRMSPEQRILMLYLAPAGEVNAADQRREISVRMTQEILSQLANAVQAPLDFVRWLIEEDVGDHPPQ